MSTILAVNLVGKKGRFLVTPRSVLDSRGYTTSNHLYEKLNHFSKHNNTIAFFKWAKQYWFPFTIQTDFNFLVYINVIHVEAELKNTVKKSKPIRTFELARFQQNHVSEEEKKWKSPLNSIQLLLMDKT